MTKAKKQELDRLVNYIDKVLSKAARVAEDLERQLAVSTEKLNRLNRIVESESKPQKQVH